jgi:hypothetical protein
MVGGSGGGAFSYRPMVFAMSGLADSLLKPLLASLVLVSASPSLAFVSAGHAEIVRVERGEPPKLQTARKSAHPVSGRQAAPKWDHVRYETADVPPAMVRCGPLERLFIDHCALLC